MISNNAFTGSHQVLLAAPDYDLAATLQSGQAFRWTPYLGGWEGVIGHRWVRLQQENDSITAQTTAAPDDWSWLIHYLQSQVRLQTVLDAFPQHDPHLDAAVRACRGLRLLRQDPWECLASFILSSTKQIVQIQQIIRLLSQRFGQLIPTPPNHPAVHTFPDPITLAQCPEAEIRACKAGFRATALRAAAERVAEGSLPLQELGSWPTAQARQRLCELHGVGNKIANCVLLFAFGKPDAFPADVWIRRALTEFYFPGLRPKPADLEQFIAGHFGSQAGYAQQYLFHYVRLHGKRLNPLQSRSSTSLVKGGTARFP